MELLSPCGNIESLFEAIDAGADAVYLGVESFNARNKARNFDLDTLKKAVFIANSLSVKVYLTLNTLIKDREVNVFFDTVKSAYESGVQAVIIQDISFISLIKKNFPDIEVHVSTQAGIHNVYGAKYVKSLGADRVILSRETSLSEIKEITKIIDTEVFVQGALCVAFSGNCYFSSFVFSESGNRGRCLQPCRKKYRFHVDGKPIVKNDLPLYYLSTKDLCLADKIGYLIEIGVKSIKIEGRLRSKEYVSTSTKYYRKLIDSVYSDKPIENCESLKRKMMICFNRGDYSQGYAFTPKNEIMFKHIQSNIGVKIKYLNLKIKNGKEFSLLTDDNVSVGSTVKILKSEDGKVFREVGTAKCLSKYGGNEYIFSSKELMDDNGVFDFRLTTAEKLIDKKVPRKKLKVSVRINISDNHITLNYSYKNPRTEYCNEEEGLVFGSYKTQKFDTSINRPLNFEQIFDCFSKTNDEILCLNIVDVSINSNIFTSYSQLNEIRRQLIDKVYSELSNEITRKKVLCNIRVKNNDVLFTEKHRNILIISNRVEIDLKKYDLVVIKPFDYCDKAYLDDIFEYVNDYGSTVFLYLPIFMNDKDFDCCKAIIEKYSVSGVYLTNISQKQFAEELYLNYIVGAELNVFNHISYDFHMNDTKCCAVVLSNELNRYDVEPFINEEKAAICAVSSLTLMNVLHCPIQNVYNIRSCTTCKHIQDKKFTILDEKGFKFPLFRQKTATNCIWRINNCLPFSSLNIIKSDGFSRLFDYSDMDNDLAVKIHDFCFSDEICFNNNEKLSGFTIANLKRSV